MAVVPGAVRVVGAMGAGCRGMRVVVGVDHRFGCTSAGIVARAPGGRPASPGRAGQRRLDG